MLRNTYFVMLTLSLFSCSQQLDHKHIATKSTELFDDSKMHSCHIYSYSEEVWDKMSSDYNTKITKDESSYRDCKIVLDGNTLAHVGIRFKGESSYKHQTNRKKSFKLKFNEFSKTGNYQGYRKVNLNNQFKDPTFMREKLMLDILNSENIPSATSSFCEVYFNEEFLGLYLLVEEINNDFLVKHFNNKKGNLINGKPNGFLNNESVESDKIEYNYKRKNHRSRKSFKKLKKLVHRLNAPIDSNYVHNLNHIFDVELCLKNWAINNVFVNVDAFNMHFPHNYLLYFDKRTKKAKWIGYDFNYSFGCWSNSLNLKQMEQFDLFYAENPVVKKVLSIDENLTFYSNYALHLVNSKIKSGWLRGKVLDYYDLIRFAVKADNNKLTSNSDFELNIEESIGDVNDPGAFVPGLFDFMEKRATQIKKQLND